MSDSHLDRETVLALLREVGLILQGQRSEATLYIVGGAAMALVFDARRITRDVDAAIFTDDTILQDAIRKVATRHQLAPTWLNSNAAAFMTNEPDTDASEVSIPGLRVTVASPEHLVAMKLRAMRRRDIEDLDVLFRHLGITAPQQAADIHNRLFDDSYIGHVDNNEALYAAQMVFDRAAQSGNPIVSEEPTTILEPDSQPAGRVWVEAHGREGRRVEGHWRRRPHRR